jgi:hypothetical protein
MMLGNVTLNYKSVREENAGYTYLPNNIIQMWMKVDFGAYTNKTIEVTFPIPFPNAVLNIQATNIATAGNTPSR